jgi:uncharacterized protein YwqG
MNHFDKYREELKQLGLSTKQDLKNIVEPLILDAIEFSPNKISQSPENSNLISHFGGQPYFEIGEEWPRMKDGRPLDFVFQLINTGDINLPSQIKVLQFYYDNDEMAWETKDEGWLVKSYNQISNDKVAIVDRPLILGTPKYCEISFNKTRMLPDWEGIDERNQTASKLSCVLDENEPWGNYQKVVEELIGEQDFISTIGGYPKWVQGGSTPKNIKGQNMQLLFQLDSKENAGLMWGDMGLVYVFYDKENIQHFEFTLQCM